VTRAEFLPAAEDEAFFASLKPAQLSFAMGLVAMRHGNYDEANEDFYNASIEDPGHALLRVFLGTSLLAVGEYGYAAEYLRSGLAGWPEFPRYVWDVTELFASTADYEAFLDSLAREVRLDPVRADVLLSSGFLEYHGGRLSRAGEAFEALSASSPDPRDQAIASAYLERIRTALDGGRLSGGLGDSEFETVEEADRAGAVGRFLGSLSLKDLPDLPLE
jgi:tetratricopeptide (TPR) repeat protein